MLKRSVTQKLLCVCLFKLNSLIKCTASTVKLIWKKRGDALWLHYICPIHCVTCVFLIVLSVLFVLHIIHKTPLCGSKWPLADFKEAIKSMFPPVTTRWRENTDSQSVWGMIRVIKLCLKWRSFNFLNISHSFEWTSESLNGLVIVQKRVDLHYDQMFEDYHSK